MCLYESMSMLFLEKNGLIFYFYLYLSLNIILLEYGFYEINEGVPIDHYNGKSALPQVNRWPQPTSFDPSSRIIKGQCVLIMSGPAYKLLR